MSDAAVLALCGCVTTLITTIGAVVLAYLKLREPIREIRAHTNGMLATANARADAAHDALAAGVAKGIEAVVAPVTHEPADQ